MKSVIRLVVFLSFVFGVISVLNFPVYAKTNLEWKETSTVYGDCDLNDKGQPIQSKTVTYTCVSKSGKDDNCILGETKVEQETEKSCNISKAYCHANSGASGYTYHYNTAWIQHIRNNGTPQAGHELDFLTWVGNRDCLTSSPSPTSTATPTNQPTFTPTSTPFATYTPTATATTTATATATATNKPCNDCNDPTATPVVTATPTATPTSTPVVTSTPTATATPNNGSSTTTSTNTDSGTGGGQVLGTSTMAATGTFEDSVFYSLFTLGSLLISLGIMKNGKKKAFIIN